MVLLEDCATRNPSRLGFAQAAGKRHNIVAPTKNSTTTSSNATRGPLPAYRASTALTNGAVTAGATICGSAAARFHTPIAAAIDPRGNTAYAIAQSAVKNAPHAQPDAAAATNATGRFGANANAPTASAMAPAATLTTMRLS